MGLPAGAAVTTDRRLAAEPAELATELTAFVAATLDALLAGAPDPPALLRRAAQDVFNTALDSALSSALDTAAGGAGGVEAVIRAAIRAVVANPLNAARPVIHAAGPAGRRPIFVVHGADGDVGWFLKHLAGVPLARPVLGLTAPGWYGEPMPGSVSGLAARHLSEVRRAQPAGPYCIAGYCAGADIAVEMARQLAAAGDEVDGLMLIDPAFDTEPADLDTVVAFRLNQLRKRRHPVMTPYFALADRASAAEVTATLARPGLPGDPVERRFYRGLLTLLGVVGADRADLATPLPFAGTVAFTSGYLAVAEGAADLFVEPARRLLGGRLRIERYDCAHVRVFEDPGFQAALTGIAARR